MSATPDDGQFKMVSPPKWRKQPEEDHNHNQATGTKGPRWLRPFMSHQRPKNWCSGVGVVVAKFTVPVLPPATGGKPANAWPKTKPNSVCWWDCHEFEHAPVGCPILHDELYDEYFMEGFFCSWGCARAYARRYVTGTTAMNVPTYIHQILRKNNIDPARADITEAPHWCVLQRFGGSMSIAEFRSLDQIRKTSGSYLTVNSETSRMFISGFDCFLQDPRIQCAPFTKFESRIIKQDDEGCYVFPRHHQRHGLHDPKPTTSANTQTPTSDDGFQAQSGDRVVTPFKKASLPKAPRKPPTVLAQPKPRKRTRQEAARYLKTSKAMKRSLGNGPETLYRQYKLVNPVVECMNIKIQPPPTKKIKVE